VILYSWLTVLVKGTIFYRISTTRSFSLCGNGLNMLRAAF